MPEKRRKLAGGIRDIYLFQSVFFLGVFFRIHKYKVVLASERRSWLHSGRGKKKSTLWNGLNPPTKDKKKVSYNKCGGGFFLICELLDQLLPFFLLGAGQLSRAVQFHSFIPRVGPQWLSGELRQLRTSAPWGVACGFVSLVRSHPMTRHHIQLTLTSLDEECMRV